MEVSQILKCFFSSFYGLKQQQRKIKGLYLNAMKKVFSQPIFHNNTERLAICFNKDDELNGLVKQIPHAKWSTNHFCWHIPLTKQHCQNAYKVLAPYASINIELLEKYLNRRKRITEIKQVTGQLVVIKPSTLRG